MERNNQINVPQAREVGSVGGQMVKSGQSVMSAIFGQCMPIDTP